MKEDIIDTMVRGLVLGVLILFGLRGVLPDIAGSQQLPVFLVSAVGAILAISAVRYAFRCARCAPTCNLKVCRAR